MAAGFELDLITVGRSCIDLYGEQVGGRLEDMRSFAKYVGGSPTNTAIGAARLGLRSGVLTRVGTDHFGRHIREQLGREQVDARPAHGDQVEFESRRHAAALARRPRPSPPVV